jgi:hypothetical protein
MTDPTPSSEEHPMTTSDPFERAARREQANHQRRRQRARRQGFMIHLAVFVAVQVLLFVTWLLTTPGGFPWFLFPFLGWAIGLAAHGVATYVLTDDHDDHDGDEPR